MLDEIIPALIGAVVGALSFFFVGWTEGQKQFEIRKAEAYVAFIKDAWAKPEDKNAVAYLDAISALTVFADPHVLKAYARYEKGNCAERQDPPECQALWAGVVNAMRESLSQDRVKPSWIRSVLWG